MHSTCDDVIAVSIYNAQADELKGSLTTFEACSAKGLGYVDGECASRSWIIAKASDDVVCTDDNTGALRYAVKGGGLELCAGKADGWYDAIPPVFILPLRLVASYLVYADMRIGFQ